MSMSEDCVAIETIVNDIESTINYGYDKGSLSSRDIDIIQAKWIDVITIAARNVNIEKIEELVVER